MINKGNNIITTLGIFEVHVASILLLKSFLTKHFDNDNGIGQPVLSRCIQTHLSQRCHVLGNAVVLVKQAFVFTGELQRVMLINIKNK